MKEGMFGSAWKSLLLQGIILFSAAASAWYFYREYRLLPEEIEARNIRTVTEKIKKIVDIPTEEDPLFFTIDDLKRFSGQNFFDRAEVGDQVLVYRNAGRAFLYRPSKGKLVDISSVNINAVSSSEGEFQKKVTPVNNQESSLEFQPENPQEVAQSFESAITKSIRIAIFDGSYGRANALKKTLEERFPKINIVLEKKASTSYIDTMVVDVTGENDKAVKNLSTFLGATATTLPAEENINSEDADILVIVGSAEH